MSSILTVNNLIAHGRFQIGAREVTAAELSAADGLLTILVGEEGAFVMIEAGATVNGITVRNQSGDDLTHSDLDLATLLVIVASPAAPYTVTLVHEESVFTTDASDRLYLPSLSTPGTFANGTLGQHQIILVWCPFVERWRAPWLAP